MATLKALVEDFLTQERIAVVGVRSTVEDAANSIYDKFKGAGYDVFAVNPKTDTYKGEPCYPSVKEIPGGVQAAMLVTRPELTEQLVVECKEAGVTHVWMHRSIGNSTSEKAIQYCRDNGINVIGGGCPMMFVEPVDFGHKCMRFIGKYAGWLPQE
ncbi:MAG TPA: CoA-binding protein [Anaerolineales bacterium]|nr:CoA-binding protein [Anaerolineales bacterium]